MHPEKKAEKIEKTTGYALLIIGLIFIIIPALLALSMFLSGSQIPQFVPTPTGETDGFVKAVTTFSNVCVLFFIFIIMVWTGSILTSRGVNIIKDVKLKLVKKSLREATETAEKLASEES